MTKKLILFDGSSLLSTSFFGNVPKEYYSLKNDENREEALKKMKIMRTSTGLYTNAVYTMSKILLKVFAEQKPSHVAVAWDISRDTFRRDMYPEYKGQRDETKPELKSQFALMQRVLQAMGITQFMVNKYEADDILGTLVNKFETEIPVFIMTKDQDSLQLVSDYTRVWLITSKAKEMYDSINPLFKHEKNSGSPENTFEFTPLYVKEFYGISPEQIVDMKALEGDSSDNIPGVKGVGEKAVIPLLQEYGTVENLYSEIENLTPVEEKQLKEFWKNSLGISRSPIAYLLKKGENGEKSAKESALLSKKLATIVRDIPELQNVKLDDLVFSLNEVGMKEIFRELEFKSLL